MMLCSSNKCPFGLKFVRLTLGFIGAKKRASIDFEIEAPFKLDREIAFVERDIVQNY